MAKTEQLKAFKGPLAVFIYILPNLLFAIIAVIVTDARDSGSIISTMFTGKKVLSGKPMDDTS